MKANECPADLILNPNTGRCVKKHGKIGKQLLKSPKALQGRFMNDTRSIEKGISKECPEEKIYNPDSKRCVKVSGKVGKLLITKQSQKQIKELPLDVIKKSADMSDVNDQMKIMSLNKHLKAFEGSIEKLDLMKRAIMEVVSNNIFDHQELLNEAKKKTRIQTLIKTNNAIIYMQVNHSKATVKEIQNYIQEHSMSKLYRSEFRRMLDLLIKQRYEKGFDMREAINIEFVFNSIFDSLQVNMNNLKLGNKSIGANRLMSVYSSSSEHNHFSIDLDNDAIYINIHNGHNWSKSNSKTNKGVHGFAMYVVGVLMLSLELFSDVQMLKYSDRLNPNMTKSLLTYNPTCVRVGDTPGTPGIPRYSKGSALEVKHVVQLLSDLKDVLNLNQIVLWDDEKQKQIH